MRVRVLISVIGRIPAKIGQCRWELGIPGVRYDAQGTQGPDGVCWGRQSLEFWPCPCQYPRDTAGPPAPGDPVSCLFLGPSFRGNMRSFLGGVFISYCAWLHPGNGTCSTGSLCEGAHPPHSPGLAQQLGAPGEVPYSRWLSAFLLGALSQARALVEQRWEQGPLHSKPTFAGKTSRNQGRCCREGS